MPGHERKAKYRERKPSANPSLSIRKSSKKRIKRLLEEAELAQKEYKKMHPGLEKEIDTLEKEIEKRDAQMEDRVRHSILGTWDAFVTILEAKSGMKMPSPRRLEDAGFTNFRGGVWQGRKLAAGIMIATIMKERARETDSLERECEKLQELLEKLYEICYADLDNFRDCECGRFWPFTCEDSLETCRKTREMIRELMVVMTPGEMREETVRKEKRPKRKRK